MKRSSVFSLGKKVATCITIIECNFVFIDLLLVVTFANTPGQHLVKGLSRATISILLKYRSLYVCKYGYTFRCASRYRAETWHVGIGDGPTRFERIFWKQTDQRSKVIQRSSCFRNAVWPSNLVGRTPDWNVMHWVKGYAEVNRGQVGGKLLRSALWPPNL